MPFVSQQANNHSYVSLELCKAENRLGDFICFMKMQVTLSADDLTKLTPEFCISKCRSYGYRYSGTQNTDQCFCDNEIGKFPRKGEG